MPSVVVIKHVISLTQTLIFICMLKT
jgi:hypothetical protein